MKIIPIQKAYQAKFRRQARIKQLLYHAGGHCAHIGKLSPGCYGCFVPDDFERNIVAGVKCNLNCPYCYLKIPREPGKNEQLVLMRDILRNSHLKGYNPTRMSFSGGGEPLLYLGQVAAFMKLFKDIEKKTGKNPWYYLYTNGVLASESALKKLQQMGLDEIRFHLGASNFSEAVYKNLQKAVKYFKAVSVETPAWPPHRKKLFAMLKRINDIGVKHLNLGEVEVTAYNYDNIAKVLPEAEIYQCFAMHLYDNGLVYDLIEEVIKKKYVYSVLDCNCFTKSIQRSPAKRASYQEVSGLCAAY